MLYKLLALNDIHHDIFNCNSIETDPSHSFFKNEYVELFLPHLKTSYIIVWM